MALTATLSTHSGDIVIDLFPRHRETGCYADFTLPAAPSPAQTRIVNTIYWAKDDPTRPKSHDTGTAVTAKGKMDIGHLSAPSGGDLMTLPALYRGHNHSLQMDKVELRTRKGLRSGPEVFLTMAFHEVCLRWSRIRVARSSG